MFDIDAYYKEHLPIHGDVSSGCVIPMPISSYKGALISLGHTIKFIGNWIQCFKVNYDNRVNIYKINHI